MTASEEKKDLDLVFFLTRVGIYETPHSPLDPSMSIFSCVVDRQGESFHDSRIDHQVRTASPVLFLFSRCLA